MDDGLCDSAGWQFAGVLVDKMNSSAAVMWIVCQVEDPLFDIVRMCSLFCFVSKSSLCFVEWKHLVFF